MWTCILLFTGNAINNLFIFVSLDMVMSSAISQKVTHTTLRTDIASLTLLFSIGSFLLRHIREPAETLLILVVDLH